MRRLSTERVGSFPIFHVLRHQVQTHDGDFDAYCLEMPDWVTVVVLTADDRFVLVRQHRHGINASTLETPGGIIDPGETPEQAAVRELREETGFVAAQMLSLGWVYPNPAIQDNRLHLMLGLDARQQGTPQPDAHEATEVVVLARLELLERMRAGELRHALCALAVQRALLHLQP